MLPTLGPELLRLTLGQLITQKAKEKVKEVAVSALLSLLPSKEKE